MVMYEVRYHRDVLKQIPKLKATGLDKKAQSLANILAVNPYQNPPPYEKLTGNLSGKISRRINIQHRLVYQVDEENNLVDILSMWTHYE